VDPVEAVAVVLSIAAVWLTTARNPLCWPVGLASVLVYGWIFIGARLYSDALLQGIFAALEVYGWWQWRRLPQTDSQPAVRPASARELWLPAGLAAAGALALGAAMARYTDAALPWLDAVLTAASLVAQYWMARMIRANWPLWIAVDVVYVGVYWSRELPLTAGLYAGFVVIAAVGWRRWGAVRNPLSRASGRGLG
jgi:nicotinamide mononucleotide transporter